MKCPLCSNDMKITSNKFVQRADGSYAKRLRFSCVSKQCPNFNKVIKTEYIPMEVVEDDSQDPA